ncbi:hypothetical protein KIL84_021160 [Mauremys mutica]|uniref:Uncharacterized protein n=1 Tax=Mauremys mutica TaxID=74926 RepID=A0A9D3XB80_9SAUR|nr:hypothetical protein KIL84_021160 [Mauremys mutica]
MAQERKRRSLPRIPELELLSSQDDETFLPSSPGAPHCQPRPGSASRLPHSPVFFPSNSPTFLTRLRVNRSIQEHHRKLKGCFSDPLQFINLLPESKAYDRSRLFEPRRRRYGHLSTGPYFISYRKHLPSAIP